MCGDVSRWTQCSGVGDPGVTTACPLLAPGRSEKLRCPRSARSSDDGEAFSVSLHCGGLAMPSALAGPLFLACGSLPDAPRQPATHEAVRRGDFEVAVRGVLDSDIQMRFQAALGQRLTERRRLEGGGRVEVGGVLRKGKKDGYVLDLDV